MWVNPKYAAQYPEPDSRPSPPEDRGRRLATLPRGQGAEMRVSLAEYEGNPFVNLRVWEKGSDGNLWPTKKGVSIRLTELEDVIAALRQVEDLVGADDFARGRKTEDVDDRPRYVERRARPQPRPIRPEDVPYLSRGDSAFDEFAGGER